MNARDRLASLVEPEPALKPGVIPTIDALDDAELPPVRAYDTVVQRDAPTPQALTLVVTGDKAGKLEELVDISLDEARKLVEEPWDFSDPRLVSAKSSMIQTIFSTQSKVDETQLRRRQVDMLPKLLELIAQKQKELPSRVIEG